MPSTSIAPLGRDLRSRDRGNCFPPYSPQSLDEHGLVCEWLREPGAVDDELRIKGLELRQSIIRYMRHIVIGQLLGTKADQLTGLGTSRAVERVVEKLRDPGHLTHLVDISPLGDHPGGRLPQLRGSPRRTRLRNEVWGIVAKKEEGG